jgi:hypothetical protein
MTKLKTADVAKSEKTIAQSDLETLQAEAGKVADLEKALATAQAQAARVADLEKTAEKVADLEKAAEKLADLEKAAEEKVLTDTIDVVKGFNLFAEEKVEDVAKHFVNNAGETSDLIIATLEKARKAIKDFGEAEHGTDLEGETTDLTKSERAVAAMGTSVMDIIKNRNSEK